MNNQDSTVYFIFLIFNTILVENCFLFLKDSNKSVFNFVFLICIFVIIIVIQWNLIKVGTYWTLNSCACMKGWILNQIISNTFLIKPAFL